MGYLAPKHLNYSKGFKNHYPELEGVPWAEKSANTILMKYYIPFLGFNGVAEVFLHHIGPKWSTWYPSTSTNEGFARSIT